jgi:hypothetical protein
MPVPVSVTRSRTCRPGWSRGRWSTRSLSTVTLEVSMVSVLSPSAVDRPGLGREAAQARAVAGHARRVAGHVPRRRADQADAHPVRYRESDCNALHRDLYGELVFPLQVVIGPDQPVVDNEGGEFLLVEQRPGPSPAARPRCYGRATAWFHHPRPSGTVRARIVGLPGPARGQHPCARVSATPSAGSSTTRRDGRRATAAQALRDHGPPGRAGAIAEPQVPPAAQRLRNNDDPRSGLCWERSQKTAVRVDPTIASGVASSRSFQPCSSITDHQTRACPSKDRAGHELTQRYYSVTLLCDCERPGRCGDPA